MKYVKIWHDSIDALEQLSDAERGRLFTAILKYGATGEVMGLGGNEKILFPMFRAQIDRDKEGADTLSQIRAEAGRKGAEVTNRQRSAKSANAEFADGKNGKCRKDKDNNEEENITTTTTTTNMVNLYTREAPTLAEVYDYFRGEVEQGAAEEAQKFYAYNSVLGWRCDWKVAADLWIARIGEKNERRKV